MAEIIYMARFTGKNGDPVVRDYKSRQAAKKAIKNAHEKNESNHFFASITIFDEDNYKLKIIFEQIGDTIVRDEK